MSDLFSYADEKDASGDLKTEEKPKNPKKKASPAKAVKDILTVTQLSNQLRMTVEGRFSAIAVEGEVSSFKKAASGHIYFDLKDEENLVKAIVWRGQAGSIQCAIEDGAQVVLHGKLTTYGARSNYQIIVSRVEFAGVGALMKKFEETKAKLEAEGLFDVESKKKIPFIPNKIGIITSPTGSVIEDMLHRIRDRFPSYIALYPVLVQGVGAKEQVAEGLSYFNHLPKEEQPDVLIVARGGGSLEDLWAFNEEIVVRTIAASNIPVISAIGHEPDVTLCDYVADLRAPTPTAAAEMVVPVKADLLYTTSLFKGKLENSMLNTINLMGKNLKLMAQTLGDPSSQLNQAKLRLDERNERFIQAFMSFTQLKKQKLETAASRLTVDVLKRQLKAMSGTLKEKEKLLISLSPQGPLKRGYVYLTTKSNAIVRKSGEVKEKDVIIHFIDGKRKATLGDEIK